MHWLIILIQILSLSETEHITFILNSVLLVQIHLLINHSIRLLNIIVHAIHLKGVDSIRFIRSLNLTIHYIVIHHTILHALSIACFFTLILNS